MNALRPLRFLLVVFGAVLMVVGGIASAAPSRASGSIDLLVRAGLRIDGAAAEDYAGFSDLVAGAGDVNGDGRQDVIMGAVGADANGRANSGSAYVIFGRASATSVDLATLGSVGFRIDGAFAGSPASGFSVAGLGDVNGDGRSDVVVGLATATHRGRPGSGTAYVVFGKTSATPVDLAALGAGGFRIDGAAASDQAGRSVAAAGDVNGDGRPDVIVGADEADSNGRPESGSAYVVFGKASTAPVDLAALGGDGYRIDGAAARDAAGQSVAGAGDVNGDGRPDVVVGAPAADPNGRTSSGSAYVVFGKASRTTVDLAALGAGGFRINGVLAQDFAGWSVAGAGDVNGDGRPDVVIGAPANVGLNRRGGGYVVFGKASSTTVELAALGAGGFHIDGARGDDATGRSVAGAGDVNRDGRPDVIVGAPGADFNGRFGSGSAYLVFGKATTAAVSLAALGARGSRIDGAAAGDQAGASVAGAGDVNGDGRPDVVVGAPSADPSGRQDAGSVHLVFRADDTTPPRLVVGADTTQQASTSGDVRISVACNEGCTVKATGTILISRSPLRFRLASAQAILLSPAPRSLVLRLTTADRSRLEQALARGLGAKAIVRAQATDSAANTTVVETTVAVR